MKTPRTIYDVLSMLCDYHQQRAKRFAELKTESVDPRADILLGHMVELETQSAQVIRSEMEQLLPEHSTYLLTGTTLRTGTTLSADALHAAACQCDNRPTFEAALGCALTSDRRLDELLDRIEYCSAAASITELAKRLREFENTKDRQISMFTRED